MNANIVGRWIRSRRLAKRSTPRILAIHLAAVAACLAPTGVRAQSYEVFPSGLVQVGNRWQFDSTFNNTPYTTTWEFIRQESVGGQNTLLLRETGGSFYIDEMNVYLTDVALTINRIQSTEYSPSRRLLATFSDPLEKFPRVVNSDDSQRNFGRGQWVTEDQVNPLNRWTRTQEQFVTFLGVQQIQVPAGVFQVVTYRVDEAAVFDSGWREEAQRVYRFHPTFGPIAMDFLVRRFDQAGRLQESFTVTHRLRFFVSAVPNLVLGEGASFDPTSVRVGANWTVSWKEVSLYRDTTTTHSTAVYLTTDTAVSQNDFRLLESKVAPIAANQTENITETLAMPATVPSGDYRVALVLDNLNEVAELSENNTYFLEGTLTVAAEPDLAVSGGSFTPSDLSPGEALSVTATVVNAGGVTVPPVWVHVYLSTDATIDASDYPLITGIQTPELALAQEHEFTRQAFVPTTFDEGTYYVGVEVDVLDGVEESDETNNTIALSPTLVVGFPDLRIAGGSFRPTLVQAGQTIRVDATVENGGMRTAGGNWIGLYLSADATITQSDTLLAEGYRSPTLAPGESIEVPANPVIPPSTPLGTYHIGLIVDLLDEVTERNEGNNAAAIGGATLVVTSPPDLVPSRLDFGPSVVDGGDPIALAGYIVNASGAPTSGSFWVEFFVSPNADFSPPRRFLCDSLLIPSLRTGQMFPLATVARTVYTDIPAGVYTYGIVVDRVDDIAEANETNNTAWVSTKRLYIGQQPTRATHWQLYR